VPKHEIRTNCPYILEKYWENRFRAKKRQGEWYDLTSADIKRHRDEASKLFDEVIRRVPSGIPHPNGSERIRTASKAYSVAQEELGEARARLNDFLTTGTVPQDLRRAS